jgi:prepilin-type N-terminal cleavage/methylation domain-containing protein
MTGSGNKGFTLLEVLVAVALVAVAAVAILALSNDVFRLLGNARDMDSLALLARETVYRHGADLRHPVHRDGVCDPPDEDCRWMIRSEPTGEPGIYLVRVTVECDRNRTITIERVIFGGGP